MDYTHDYNFAEMSGQFKGFIKHLLAEAFIDDDIYECIPEQQRLQEKRDEARFIQQYAKPFT